MAQTPNGSGEGERGAACPLKCGRLRKKGRCPGQTGDDRATKGKRQRRMGRGRCQPLRRQHAVGTSIEQRLAGVSLRRRCLRSDFPGLKRHPPHACGRTHLQPGCLAGCRRGQGTRQRWQTGCQRNRQDGEPRQRAVSAQGVHGGCCSVRGQGSRRVALNASCPRGRHDHPGWGRSWPLRSAGGPGP